MFLPIYVFYKKCCNLRMDNKEIRRQNLLHLIDSHKKKGVNQAQFAEKIGVSASYLTQIKTGNASKEKDAGIGDNISKRIEAALDLEKGWMDRIHQSKVETPIARYGQPNVGEMNIQPTSVPILSYVQAGKWREAIQSKFDEYIYSHRPVSQESFALEVRGLSMLPEFKEGDHIIVDPNVFPSPGNYVVAKNGLEEATFKKYRPRGLDINGNAVFELVPLNPDFETLRSDIDKIRIIGTVVEHIRRLR